MRDVLTPYDDVTRYSDDDVTDRSSYDDLEPRDDPERSHDSDYQGQGYMSERSPAIPESSDLNASYEYDEELIDVESE